jgi:hypothetical protein
MQRRIRSYTELINLWLARPTAVAALVVAIWTSPVACQSTQQDNARAIISKSVQAMGGDALANFGAATSMVTVTGPNLPEQKFTWSDDWTNKSVRSRRELQYENGSLLEIYRGETHYLKTPDKSTPLQPEFDLSNLLYEYPAVALRVALSRSNCNFHEVKDTVYVSRGEVGSIEMVCGTPVLSSRHLRLLWWFAPDGLPSKVRIFAADPKLSTQRFKNIVYNDFGTVQGVAMPVSVDLTDGAKQRHFTFSSQAFAASLPVSLFPIRNPRSQK